MFEMCFFVFILWLSLLLFLNENILRAILIYIDIYFIYLLIQFINSRSTSVFRCHFNKPDLSNKVLLLLLLLLTGQTLIETFCQKFC